MESKTKRGSWVKWFVVWLVFVAGYLLGLGPVQRGVVKGYLPGVVYELYGPVIWYIRLKPPAPLTRWYWSYLNAWL